MTQLSNIDIAATSFRSIIHRTPRLAAFLSVTLALPADMLRSFVSAYRHAAAARQYEEALRRLDQFDEHRLHDIGLARVEKTAGWKTVARGAAPIAIKQHFYLPLPDTESISVRARTGMTRR